VVYDGAPGSDYADYETKLKVVWNGVRDLTEVYAVDECLYVINKVSGIDHDKQFRGFHFYGADICYNYRQNGYKIYASMLPLIHHGSFSGSLRGNNDYWPLFKMLANKWKEKYPKCFGTHMHWKYDSINKILEMSSYITAEAVSNSFHSKILYATINENSNDRLIH
jgi:hypothetical protein